MWIGACGGERQEGSLACSVVDRLICLTQTPSPSDRTGRLHTNKSGHRRSELVQDGWSFQRDATGCASAAGPANTETMARLAHMRFGMRGRGRCD